MLRLAVLALIPWGYPTTVELGRATICFSPDLVSDADCTVSLTSEECEVFEDEWGVDFVCKTTERDGVITGRLVSARRDPVLSARTFGPQFFPECRLYDHPSSLPLASVEMVNKVLDCTQDESSP